MTVEDRVNILAAAQCNTKTQQLLKLTDLIKSFYTSANMFVIFKERADSF